MDEGCKRADMSVHRYVGLELALVVAFQDTRYADHGVAFAQQLVGDVAKRALPA